MTYEHKTWTCLFHFNTLVEKAVQKHVPWEFPGGPVVRFWRFHCQAQGSIRGQGTKIPASHVACPKTKTKKHVP